MQKLKSFDQFSTEVKISQTRQIEEDTVAKRSDSAESFKNLLSEFKVTSIKELTEEQRVDFFTKLRDTEVNEAVELIEEGTRGQVGIIDKKGNITSIYTHYDSYPENVLPVIKKHYKNAKSVKELVAKGNSSGIDALGKMNFYNDGSPVMKGSIANVKGYLQDASDDGGAEFVYLWDEANKEWLMSDIYAKMELAPAFENLSISVNEAIKVEYKRDAKKVLTVYRNLFAKRLTDFGAMSNVAVLGCIKYLFENAMEDANFHREMVISKHIKGFIGSFEVKMPGLGNYYIKIGATTTKRILDQYYSDIANASGWSGVGIVEGTALYLESIKQEAMGQSLISAFDVAFNESVVNEAKELGLGDKGVDYNDNVVEIIEIGKFDKVAKSFKKEMKADAEDYGFEKGAGEFYLTKNIETEEGNVGDLAIYPVKYDITSYWGLDPVKESLVTEAKFKKGQYIKSKNDSDDFDGDVYDRTNDVDGSEILKNSSFEIYEIGKDEVVLWSDADEVEYSIDPDDLKKHFVKESVVTEAEVSSIEDFQEYATTVLQKAFGEEFDKERAQKVIDGILAKADGDYGTAVGMLTSSLGS